MSREILNFLCDILNEAFGWNEVLDEMKTNQRNISKIMKCR